MRMCHLNGLLIVAILAISTVPLYGQRQQQNVAKLKSEARNVVGTIANDKAKTQTYCQILDLARQLAKAEKKKKKKKEKTLGERKSPNRTTRPTSRGVFRNCQPP